MTQARSLGVVGDADRVALRPAGPGAAGSATTTSSAGSPAEVVGAI